ncbi:MAG: hypothetical protein M1832_005278 [Thelocarpon impressellum]|nr:MAG: hypothetical protein M1832_005278 [Thelocarpon impressellum]
MPEILSEALFDQARHDVEGDGEGKGRAGEQVNDLKHICKVLHARVSAFLQHDAVDDERLRMVQGQTTASLEVIREALQRYSLDEISLSYNGGKDCLVLLILFLAALATAPVLPRRLQSVYIISPSPFPEVDSFVTSSSAAYHLDLAHYELPMKAAFELYLKERPRVKAILVGTRRTDPHGGTLGSFDRTDHGWPDFMRVHPVLEWRYADIWTVRITSPGVLRMLMGQFIRHLDIPYCSLYDRGYTSLGGTNDTHPNPALRREAVGQAADRGGYRAAYELVDDEAERLGRDR